jgi:hypothetical protein
MTQAPFEMSDQVMGKLKQPLRDATGIHQAARQDEKRDGEEGETCRAGVHSRREHAQNACLPQYDKKDHGRQTHGEGDRKPTDDQKYQHTKDGSSHHGNFLSNPGRGSSPLLKLLKKQAGVMEVDYTRLFILIAVTKIR